MKQIGCIIFVLCLFLWTHPALAQNSEKQNAAITAAQEWLALIDAGQYAQSWQVSAAYFRNAVAEDKWEQVLKATRQPFYIIDIFPLAMEIPNVG